VKNTDALEVPAVVPLPTAEERKRRETVLARVMLLAVDLVVSGEGLGLETALDLVREIWNCYPELLAKWDEV